jgi:hypothetical protein
MDTLKSTALNLLQPLVMFVAYNITILESHPTCFLEFDLTLSATQLLLSSVGLDKTNIVDSVTLEAFSFRGRGPSSKNIDCQMAIISVETMDHQRLLESKVLVIGKGLYLCSHSIRNSLSLPEQSLNQMGGSRI